MGTVCRGSDRLTKAIGTLRATASFFDTSEIALFNLLVGMGLLAVLIAGNRLGMLVASVVAGIVGSLILRLAPSRVDSDRSVSIGEGPKRT